MLKIKNLHVSTGDTPVLKGIDLDISAGETHAIMGPNGSGKSTLAKVIAGHPGYTVTQGSIEYETNFSYTNILDWAPDIRAKEGIFLAFQYPVEVPGITNRDFLNSSFHSICKHQGIPEMKDDEFQLFLEEKLKVVDMNPSFLDRSVNHGFSGGEKKRNEILQMAVLSPKLSLLDETDSGLDVDALRIVSNGVNSLRNKNNAIVLITHYQRLLDHIVPDFVHILADGKIIESGDKNLARKIEDRGYDWLIN